MEFGFVEYDTVEGALKCLRLLNELKIGDEKLKINADKKTEIYLQSWQELKRKEWAMKQSSQCKFVN